MLIANLVVIGVEYIYKNIDSISVEESVSLTNCESSRSPNKQTRIT